MMAFLKMCFRSNKFESKWMKQNEKITSGLVKSNIRQNFSTTAILLYISCIFTRVMNIEILYFDIFNRSFLHCFKHKSVEKKKSRTLNAFDWGHCFQHFISNIVIGWNVFFSVVCVHSVWSIVSSHNVNGNESSH